MENSYLFIDVRKIKVHMVDFGVYFKMLETISDETLLFKKLKIYYDKEITQDKYKYWMGTKVLKDDHSFFLKVETYFGVDQDLTRLFWVEA